MVLLSPNLLSFYINIKFLSYLAGSNFLFIVSYPGEIGAVVNISMILWIRGGWVFYNQTHSRREKTVLSVEMLVTVRDFAKLHYFQGNR